MAIATRARAKSDGQREFVSAPVLPFAAGRNREQAYLTTVAALPSFITSTVALDAMS
jgi:hypothetical protein